MTTDINLWYCNKWITKYLQLKHIDLYKSFKKWSDLNEHLKEIRLSQEPKKIPSNSVENNSAYISEL
jgi:hypothetical protein